jgi:hypothetical protein
MGGETRSVVGEISRDCVSIAENHSGRISSVLNDPYGIQNKVKKGQKGERKDELDQSSGVGISTIELNLKRPLGPPLADEK